MPFRKRLWIVGILTMSGVLAYGTARHYSETLISYVVEQALLQKLPAGFDPAQSRDRFRDLLSSLPNHQARLEKLLSLSQYLEKLQTLTPQELDQLLRKDSSSPRQDRSSNYPEHYSLLGCLNY